MEIRSKLNGNLIEIHSNLLEIGNHIFCKLRKQFTSMYTSDLIQFCFHFDYFTADNLSQKFGSQINELWDSFGQDFTYPGNLPAYADEYFEEETSPTKAINGDIMAGSIQCLPLPGKKQKWKNFLCIMMSFVYLSCNGKTFSSKFQVFFRFFLIFERFFCYFFISSVVFSFLFLFCVTF